VIGRYCWLDLETTGLLPGKCEVCEVACIITDPHSLEEVAVFTRIIDARDAYWQHQALEMHKETGLYDLMAKAPPLNKENLVTDLQKFLWEHISRDNDGTPVQYHIAGSSVWFDRQYISNLFSEENMRQFFSNRIVDVSSIKMEIRSTCGDEVAHFFDSAVGLSRIKHRALEDIKHSIAMLRDFRNRGLIGGPRENV
jgi:oligoribonuclease